MATRGRRHTMIAAALAFSMASTVPAGAAGWGMRAIETPLGDKAVGLGMPSTRFADVRRVIGCDGESGTGWRGVAVVEGPCRSRSRWPDSAPRSTRSPSAAPIGT